MLRSKILGTKNDLPSIDNDNEIERNFWKYAKAKIKKASELVPSFSKITCVKYFQNIFSKSRSQLIFQIPNWMPSYEEPKKPFNLQPPSYEELNKIIYRMKTSAAPCSLDQISIITLKRCPYLRTYLLEVIKTAWSTKVAPDEWKKAITIRGVNIGGCVGCDTPQSSKTWILSGKILARFCQISGIIK